MSLIVTPGQFTDRAEFYHQLQQLTSAGIGIVDAMNHIQRNPPARSYREPSQKVVEQLAEGCTFSEALSRVGKWLPEFDTTLIAAGEQSGRIDQSFRLLAEHYTERANLAKQMISDLAYPVFLFHFAVAIFALIAYVNEHFGSQSHQLIFLGVTVHYWALILFGGTIPVYLVAAFLIYAGQSRHGEAWRSWVEQFLRPVPVLGTARRFLALARLSAALEALLSAGVTIVEAWELSAAASGSPAMRRTVHSWRPLLLAGKTPAEIVNSSGKFPDLFCSQYHAGEVSGKLDETLDRLHHYYRDEGSRKLHAVARWLPRAVYLIIVLGIAYYILQFYVGYFNQVRDAGGF